MIDKCPAVQHVPWHLPIGVAVTVLAPAGVIVPWVMSSVKNGRSKWFFSIVFGLLAALEIWSIHFDQKQQQQEHLHEDCEQRQQFEDVRERLVETNDAANASARNASRAAVTARTAVDQLTGGNSFLLITPVESPKQIAISDQVPMLLANRVYGSAPLWDVHVQGVTGDIYGNEIPQSTPIDVPLGNVSNTYLGVFPKEIAAPLHGARAFTFWTFARNRPTIERLAIRRNHVNNTWEYKLEIRSLKSSKRLQDIGKQILLKKAWTLVPKPPTETVHER